MANVNVNRSVTDQFYRYKMPRLIAKVEGKGNGIKTVIVNMVDIAKALSRPPAYPTKYFGCELGAQTQFNVKDERYIVNGAHDAGRLQDLLDGFIKKFVLCPECDNPETNLHVQVKKQMIVQRCIACGHHCNIDMRHKLTTFILKNPPDMDHSTTTPSKKEKGKKGKGKGKDKDAVNGDDRGSPEPANEGHTPEGTSRQTSTADSWEDDDDWGDDVSDAAVKQRMEMLTDAAKALAMSDELEKTQQERLELLYEYVKTKKAEGMVPGSDKEILAEADRLDVKDKGPLVLVEILLADNILHSIKQYRNHFLRFTNENAKAQKYLLGGLEQLINAHKDALLPKVPHVLKLFYDGDILDEEVLVDWHKKVSKKYVSKELSKEIHAKADPFIKWLQEAEEEESESDEEELDVVYSTTQKVGTHVVKEEPVNNKEEEEEEDDFDIDAI